MTLRELIRNNPGMFYSQSWYADEPFMDADEPECLPTEIPAVTGYDGIPPELISYQLETETVPAVTLARMYISRPDHPIWMRYLWTSDMDSEGQRVFVGENGDGFEIHRHLHITNRFGVPVWPMKEKP